MFLVSSIGLTTFTVWGVHYLQQAERKVWMSRRNESHADRVPADDVRRCPAR